MQKVALMNVFDGGILMGVIFVLTGARISHESKCVSQAQEEMEGRCIVALTPL